MLCGEKGRVPSTSLPFPSLSSLCLLPLTLFSLPLYLFSLLSLFLSLSFMFYAGLFGMSLKELLGQIKPQRTLYLSSVTMMHGYTIGLDVIWQYYHPQMRMSRSDKFGSLSSYLTIDASLVFQADISAQRPIAIFRENMPCSHPFASQVWESICVGVSVNPLKFCNGGCSLQQYRKPPGWALHKDIINLYRDLTLL